MAIIIEERLSPNFNERPMGKPVDSLILHYTGMTTGAAAIDRLCDPMAKVSAHYVVGEQGHITRLVSEQHRAWHAGVSSWAGETDINGSSIGIEIVNGGHDFGAPPYPAAQMQALVELCREIVARHPIARRKVLGHSDIAPERKSDPGEWFDWQQLAEAGIGHWVPPELVTEGPVLKPGDRGDTVAETQFLLASYGYGLEVLGIYDQKTEAVMRAFQRHFRPRKIDGIADISSVLTLKRLTSAS